MPKTEAGPELDARVAVEVMGWKVHPRNTAHWMAADDDVVEYRVKASTCGRDRWSPSTDWSAAGEVLEKLRDLWAEATKDTDGFSEFPKPFDDTVFFDLLRRQADRRWPWALLFVTPETICLAALEAVKTTQDGP